MNKTNCTKKSPSKELRLLLDMSEEISDLFCEMRRSAGEIVQKAAISYKSKYTAKSRTSNIASEGTTSTMKIGTCLVSIHVLLSLMDTILEKNAHDECKILIQEFNNTGILAGGYLHHSAFVVVEEVRFLLRNDTVNKIPLEDSIREEFKNNISQVQLVLDSLQLLIYQNLTPPSLLSQFIYSIKNIFNRGSLSLLEEKVVRCCEILFINSDKLHNYSFFVHTCFGLEQADGISKFDSDISSSYEGYSYNKKPTVNNVDVSELISSTNRLSLIVN